MGFLYQDLLPPAADLAGALHETTLPGAAQAGLSDTAQMQVLAEWLRSLAGIDRPGSE